MIFKLLKRACVRDPARLLHQHRRTAEQIIFLGDKLQNEGGTVLRERATLLRQRAMTCTSLDELTIPMFSLVREAARRELGEPHVAPQLIAGLTMHRGSIAEMATGEGKTLAATLPCALNALSGGGVHVATPNDYLAERDAAWMRPVYEALGLSVGVITQHLDDDSRRAAYACDVTYGAGSEFGFDYLRDNMKFSAAETVQRGHTFALIDEADSILLDQAGMPLALFNELGDQSDFYRLINAIVAGLRPEHCSIDDRQRVTLTDTGYDEVEGRLRQAALLTPHASLHDVHSISILHHVIQALRAHHVLLRDRDYVVADGAIVIIDSFTARPVPGRRFDGGLHQALEAKEGCSIGAENRTLASITYQTFFCRYRKLAGMTATAADDADEYKTVYGLDVISIPRHRLSIRQDTTVLHVTRTEKLEAVLDEISKAHTRGQPVLVGVPSIEHSDELAALLRDRGWSEAVTAEKHFSVLSAKHHAVEARIIAQAGRPGSLTIATAMAGRGTDIRLGGSDCSTSHRDQVIAAGGLLVIGTEHHDHVRLDAQLRGRAGRQGEPGRSVFHASLQDALFQHSKNRQISRAPVDPVLGQRLLAAAQKRHASRSFNGRWALLQFDATIQRQQETIYTQRRAIRDDPEPLAVVATLRNETINDLLTTFLVSPRTPDFAGLDDAIRSILTLDIRIPRTSKAIDAARLHDLIAADADRWMRQKAEAISGFKEILRRLMLAVIDELWAEQTERLERLKIAVGDRRVAGHRATAEFQRDAFALFEQMILDFRHEVTAHAMRIGIRKMAAAYLPTNIEISYRVDTATASPPLMQLQRSAEA